MAFWTDQKLKEPLRQNRWYINFNVTDSSTFKGLDNYKFALKECKKPEYEISLTEHRLLSHHLHYPGLLKWKPITVKILSARGEGSDSVSVVLDNIARKAGYFDPTEFLHQDIAKAKFERSLETNVLELIQVDANGKDIEIWKLYNALLKDVSYGSLTYENDGFVEISLTIQYDWAKLETFEGSDENFNLNAAKSLKPSKPEPQNQKTKNPSEAVKEESSDLELPPLPPIEEPIPMEEGELPDPPIPEDPVDLDLPPLPPVDEPASDLATEPEPPFPELPPDDAPAPQEPKAEPPAPKPAEPEKPVAEPAPAKPVEPPPAKPVSEPPAPKPADPEKPKTEPAPTKPVEPPPTKPAAEPAPAKSAEPQKPKEERYFENKSNAELEQKIKGLQEERGKLAAEKERTYKEFKEASSVDKSYQRQMRVAGGEFATGNAETREKKKTFQEAESRYYNSIAEENLAKQELEFRKNKK